MVNRTVAVWTALCWSTRQLICLLRFFYIYVFTRQIYNRCRDRAWNMHGTCENETEVGGRNQSEGMHWRAQSQQIATQENWTVQRPPSGRNLDGNTAAHAETIWNNGKTCSIWQLVWLYLTLHGPNCDTVCRLVLSSFPFPGFGFAKDRDTRYAHFPSQPRMCCRLRDWMARGAVLSITDLLYGCVWEIATPIVRPFWRFWRGTWFCQPVDGPGYIGRIYFRLDLLPAIHVAMGRNWVPQMG